MILLIGMSFGKMLELLALIVLLIGFLLLQQKEQRKQDIFIDNYKFPKRVELNIKELYQHLTDEDVQIILEGLKEYFKLYIISNRRMIVIPSLLISKAWYEFMQSKSEYNDFCQNAFGFFLHHAPIVKIQQNEANYDLKVLWTLVCNREDINPNDPNKLPFIFLLDEKFKINAGYKFSLSSYDNTFYNVKNIGSLSVTSAKGGRAF